jgi:hydroxyethylthiazole kinase-like uncharacterized protein yjeF
MKILSAIQIKEADAYTIRQEPIASIDLMERASKAFCSWFTDRFDTEITIGIICGTGNNGGDGLAVARLLFSKGYQVTPYVMGTSGTDDFQMNYDRLLRDMEILEYRSNDHLEFNHDVLIDALFGSGLTRSPSGLYQEVIDRMNQSRATKIALDIASGLYCDKSSVGNTITKADYTVSFQLAKLGSVLAENDDHTGFLDILDIGLDEEYLKREVTPYHLVTQKFVRPLVQQRNRHAHKGNFGRGGIVAGSYGKMGAAVLACKAFMRAGGGLLTAFAPACGYEILQSVIPEAMVEPSGDRIVTELHESLFTLDAVGIGPGLGVAQESYKFLEKLLTSSSKPMVIDADALNLISQHRDLMGVIPDHSILTPHPREFERLFGVSDNDFTRLQQLIAASQRLNCYIILKGAYSATATPEGSVFFNSSGNPGMATAGSGDVLTGIITSLLAQGQTSFHAAVLGVYLHGLAGDLARDELGEQGLIASDIIESLPYAIRIIQENNE